MSPSSALLVAMGSVKLKTDLNSVKAIGEQKGRDAQKAGESALAVEDER